MDTFYRTYVRSSTRRRWNLVPLPSGRVGETITRDDERIDRRLDRVLWIGRSCQPGEQNAACPLGDGLTSSGGIALELTEQFLRYADRHVPRLRRRVVDSVAVSGQFHAPAIRSTVVDSRRPSCSLDRVGDHVRNRHGVRTIRLIRLGPVDERAQCRDHDNQIISFESNPSWRQPVEIIDVHLEHNVTHQPRDSSDVTHPQRAHQLAKVGRPRGSTRVEPLRLMLLDRRSDARIRTC